METTIEGWNGNTVDRTLRQEAVSAKLMEAWASTAGRAHRQRRHRRLQCRNGVAFSHTEEKEKGGDGMGCCLVPKRTMYRILSGNE
ncbi:hypothetical protein MUK42_13110 [Musa troglodytarum]|uniref:Uncharacterized protein n=1 Tax=Musa troglodytarum TaxID=320322 RepID=A0A9E7IKC1_9LILI|nr:hypothetical protein MUK42_13110 [Musa troglodytarum]